MPEELPQAVLFACTMNAIRSPMAAAMLRRLHPQSVFVDSVGVRRSESVDGFAVAVMSEMGLDISDHRPRTFRDLEDANFDLIVSLSPEAQHSAVDMTSHMSCDIEFWPTLDPSVIEGSREVRLEAFRSVRDSLWSRVRERFPVTSWFADI